ncbi:hypothetical protein [Streptomyces boninensis]|uniref:hypothetical protein n=1 Tax=Streptomyces boninensis TaxID=2039455 RepID=UPI003B220A34
MTASPPEPPAHPRTPRLMIAAALAGVEAAVVAGLGLYELVMLVVGDPDSKRQALFGGLTVLALAALPAAAAYGLWQRKSWSRGPAVITQLMAIPVVWAMTTAGGVLLPLGIALGAVALTALVCLLSPSTTEALGVGPREAS